MTANEELRKLHEAEVKAFYAFGKAQRGDDGPSRNSAISPKRVREARARWYAAREALIAAGGTPTHVRKLLAEGWL